MKDRLRILIFMGLLGSAATTVAQEDALLRAAFAGVAEIGKQWNGEVNAATQALYTPLHRNAPSEGLVLHGDIAYGEHPLQTFDLWISELGSREGGPVLIYFHGGGLTGGDKVSAATDNLIYSNVGKFAAQVGGIGINANYRLAPQATWPGMGESPCRGIRRRSGQHLRHGQFRRRHACRHLSLSRGISARRRSRDKGGHLEFRQFCGRYAGLLRE